MHSFQPLAREDNLTRICTGEPASKPGGAVGLTIALLEFCAIASSQPSSQPSVDCGIRLLLIISSPLHSRCRAAEVWMESASRTEKRNKGARPSDRKSEESCAFSDALSLLGRLGRLWGSSWGPSWRPSWGSSWRQSRSPSWRPSWGSSSGSVLGFVLGAVLESRPPSRRAVWGVFGVRLGGHLGGRLGGRLGGFLGWPGRLG